MEVKGRIVGRETSHFWEEATVTHDGLGHTAMGGCVNDVMLNGYPHPLDMQTGVLTTFSGNVSLGRYRVTGIHRQWNPFSRDYEQITRYVVWTPDRRVFSGRNGGLGMLLKCRRSKGLTEKYRTRLGVPKEW